MQMFTADEAAQRGWMSLPRSKAQWTPRAQLLAAGLCNGLHPETFTSDGWVHAFHKQRDGDLWAIWRTATGFRSARLVEGRYVDHESHNSLRSATLRVTGEWVH